MAQLPHFNLGTDESADELHVLWEGEVQRYFKFCYCITAEDLAQSLVDTKVPHEIQDLPWNWKYRAQWNARAWRMFTLFYLHGCIVKKLEEYPILKKWLNTLIDVRLYWVRVARRG